jgi:hypothetical protein
MGFSCVSSGCFGADEDRSVQEEDWFKGPNKNVGRALLPAQEFEITED